MLQVTESLLALGRDLSIQTFFLSAHPPEPVFFMLRVLNLPAPSLRASPADKMLQGPGNLFWAVGMAATRWLLCCLITHFQSVHTPPHAVCLGSGPQAPYTH